MRHLDALHAHVQQAQDKGRVEARGAHDRRDADPLGRHHAELHVVQVEARVLHVDKSGVKPREPDDLDDLRVGDAADMRPQSQPALAHDFFTRFSCIFAVGTFIAERPPHRSERAQFGHSAPTSGV